MPSPEPSGLSPERVERVLERLGLSSRPEPCREGLAAVYGAWCRGVPFDNVAKRVRLAEGGRGPLPGDEPDEFFATWLSHGVGGTCWAASGALRALLAALGFRARRGVATMLVAPDLPPNHGTVAVELDGACFLVDPAMLHERPLPLDPATGGRVAHGAWGVEAAAADGTWVVRWRPLHAPEGLDCRIDRVGADADEYRRRHEETRAWSPFNFSTYARINRGSAAVGAALGHRVELRAEGEVARTPLDRDGCTRLLVEELGMSEAMVARLPPDRPIPPPPGSRTAARARSSRGRAP